MSSQKDENKKMVKQGHSQQTGKQSAHTHTQKKY